MNLTIFKIEFVLLILLILFIRNGNSQTDIVTTPGKAADSVVVLAEMNISFDELYTSFKWSRNPFAPMYHLKDPKNNGGEYQELLLKPFLENLFWAQNSRVALINENNFQKGEYFLDMKILYIGETVVMFEKNGSPCLLIKIEREDMNSETNE
ncbi:hypothetical protein GF337_10790 [candidate division KSB1 bacterium]|nr:hypothetical protein [candidate division KSB1 bacterium]